MWPFKATAKYVEALIVYFRNGNGLGEHEFEAINKFCSQWLPSSIEIVSPLGVLLTYAGSRAIPPSSEHKFKLCTTEVLTACPDIRMGMSRGQILGALGRDGIFVGQPLGIDINQAMEIAYRSTASN
jgi:hypothetical protein